MLRCSPPAIELDQLKLTSLLASVYGLCSTMSTGFNLASGLRFRDPDLWLASKMSVGIIGFGFRV